MVRDRDVQLKALLILLYAAVVGAELAFGSWLPSYAMAAGIDSFPSALHLASAFWGTLTLGRGLISPLLAHIKPLYGMLVYCGSATFAALLLIAAKPSEPAPLSVP